MTSAEFGLSNASYSASAMVAVPSGAQGYCVYHVLWYSGPVSEGTNKFDSISLHDVSVGLHDVSVGLKYTPMACTMCPLACTMCPLA